MKTLHTATPWEVEGLESEAPYRICHKDGGLNAHIAYIDGVTQHGNIAQANAAYIVKCVNSHEQLVEALTEIILHFRKGNLSIKDFEILNVGSKALQITEGVSND